jgi:hypothetical protein
MRAHGDGFSGVQRSGVVTFIGRRSRCLLSRAACRQNLAKVPDIGGVNRIAWGSA